MLGGLISVVNFLVSVVFGIYAFVLLFRFFLQWVKADFYNPVCQLVMRITNPIILPLRKIIPGFFGLDWSCIVAAYLIYVVENIIFQLIGGLGFSLLLTLVKPFLDVILAIVNMYIYLIFIRAIASWFTQGGYNYAFIVIHQVTEPLLNKVRNFINSKGHFDFSPIVILILLFCVEIFLKSILYSYFL